jgi:hypothetical protein
MSEVVDAPLLQATWTESHVFLWSRQGPLDAALAEVPALAGLGRPAERTLALRAGRSARATLEGRDVPLERALPVLGTLPHDAVVSDALRCWSHASKLALELAARRRAVPTVRGGRARWVPLLSRREDRERFEAIAAAMPPAARLVPTTDRGAVRLRTATDALARFLDAAIDAVFRRRAYPGPARGWALDLANALRAEEDAFVLRDARFQAMPGRIATWANATRWPVPRVALTLALPGGPDDQPRFPLHAVAQSPADPTRTVPVAAAFEAGPHLAIGDDTLYHPAESVLRGLARCARIWPPLRRLLAGPRPTSVALEAREAWEFLDRARNEVERAGFAVQLPAAFADAGRQRIRARIRLGMPARHRDGRFDLQSLLTWRWEVLVGEAVVPQEQFAALRKTGRTIVKWRGEWVFLDPDELARLPAAIETEGQMSAAQALSAVLTGTHEGVPVVADASLADVIAAIRNPPDLARPPGLHGSLRGYQARGYAWLSTLGALGLGALLADDMGLGKTLQLVSHLLGRAGEGLTSLVVCPTSVLGNWQREIRKFAPSLQVLRWHGTDRDGEELPDAEVVLTTYGILVRDADFLARQQWDVVALDEAQLIKNPDSRRARAARRLRARHRVALTGTPVENRLDELWSVFEFLVPGLLGPRATFHRQIAVPVERFGDAEAAALLRRTTAPFLLRRVKTDQEVAADLPDKLERREYCTLTDEQRALYQEAVEAAMTEIAESEEMARRGRVLAMLTALKQICNHPYHYLKKRDPSADPTLAGRSGKLDRASEIAEAVAARGEHLVVFTQFREMGEMLAGHLGGLLGEPIPFLHGGTTLAARDHMVRLFQSDAPDVPPVLVVSLKAGGTGLTLTRASHVLHFDRWWNPAVEDQATDRTHRIGQHRNVQVYKLVCEGTLEERIDTMLEEKRELFAAVIGKGERWVTELDDDALRRLVMLAGDPR